MANQDANMDGTQALSEREKMMRGLAYDAMVDSELMRLRLRARKFLKAFNDSPPAEYVEGMKPTDCFGPDIRFESLAELFGVSIEKARTLAIEPPFHCDYGINIEFKGDFYSNFNLTILDCAKVTIGSRVLCAPNVHIYSATHSVEVAERRAGLERAYPVTIGDDVWIGGNVSIIGPCTIGNGVTIAAGSTVRGIVPDNVVYGGNPGRILKRLDPPPPLTEAQEKMETGTLASVP